MSVAVTCAACGRKYQVDEKLLGRKVRCKGCESAFTVARDGEAASEPAVDEGPDLDALSALSAPAGAVAEAEAAPPALKRGGKPLPLPPPVPAQTCPQCGSAVQPGAVLCVGCGFNLKTGAQISTQVVKELPAPVSAGPVPIPGMMLPPQRRSRVRTGGDISIGTVLGWIAGLIVLAIAIGVGAAFSTGFSKTAGIFLLIAGILLAAWGNIAGIMTAFREGAVTGLMYMFVPFYALVFLITRWSEMKVPFGLSCLGSLVLGFGAVLFGSAQTREMIAEGIAQKQAEIAKVQQPPRWNPSGGNSGNTGNPGPGPRGGDTIGLPAGGEDPVAFYKSKLSSQTVGVRLDAVDHLMRLCDQRPGDVGDALDGCLSDSEPRVRRLAVQGIGRTNTDQTVPRLAKAMSDQDSLVRTTAADKLRQVPAARQAEAAKAFEQVLTHQDREIRSRAVYGVALVKTDRTVPTLIRCLDDSERSIRAAALGQLGKYKDPAAIGPICAKLAVSPSEAAEALAAYGKEADAEILKAFEGLLKHQDAKVRATAVEQVATRSPERAGDLILPLLNDSDVVVKAAAAKQLAALRHPAAVEAIAGQFKNIGEPAVAALISFGASAEKPMIAKLGDSDAWVRAAAARVLKSVGTSACEEALRAAVKDSNAEVAAAAKAALKKIAPDAWPASADALVDLESSDAARRRKAYLALADLEVDKNQETIAKKLYELAMGGDENDQWAIRKPLAKWASKDIVTALIDDATGGDGKRRSRAIALLGEIKDPAAIPVLAQIAAAPRRDANDRDTSPWEAASALEKFGAAAEDEVLKLLKGDNTTAQQVAIRILKEHGTKKCIGPLNTLARMSKSFIIKDTAKEAADTVYKRVNPK